jgi:hypothetical protein
MLHRVERPKHPKRVGRVLLALSFSVLAMALAGCGGSVASYCNEAKNCEGGNDLDEEACNIRGEEIAELADLQNCGSEYDEYFECVDEGSRCNNDRYAPDEGACNVQANRLAECADIGGL